ncbi:MAG: class I tRNA ligase family protein [Candidatus Poribacteria bacterium]|nr:class I tRNA ligase family protein [Candidatus Poribacteria bacterium]
MAVSKSFDAFRKQALEGARDADLVERWEEIALLAQLRQKNKGKDKHVFHDIPRPPQNDLSPLLLSVRMRKDIYLKAAALMGFNVAYSPSWDLFDGGVENEALREENAAGRPFESDLVRGSCKRSAQERMETERAALKQLGVFADWRGVKPHLEARYEAKLLDSFGRLMTAGLVQRELKPGCWCIQCRTDLSEAEQAVCNRKSTGAYIRFPLRAGLERLGPNAGVAARVFELWTLPAGAALALSPDASYEAVQFNGSPLVIEKGSADKFPAESQIERIETIEAAELLQCICSHPLLDAELPIVMRGEEEGAFVLVSPSGKERPFPQQLFLASDADPFGGRSPRLAYNYRIGSIMNESGEMTEEAETFCGLSIQDAHEHIALRLDYMGMLIRADDGEIAYPHCWTCDSPAAFRPIDHWTFDASESGLLRRVVQGMELFETHPSGLKERLKKSVPRQERWEASQPGVWGLPIPAFYCQKCGEQLDVERSVKTARDLISHKGTDAWFSVDPDDALPNDAACPSCGAREFRRDTSVMKPWTASLLDAIQNMDSRRENAKIGDIFMERADDALDWIARLLTLLYALRDGCPTKFLHYIDLKKSGPQLKASADPKLMRILEQPGGSDLFRLFALRHTFSTKTSAEDAAERLEEQRAEFENALLRAAFLTQKQTSPKGDADIGSIPYLPALFAAWFDSVKVQTESAFQTYYFDAAWETLRGALRRFETMADYLETARTRLPKSERGDLPLTERAFYECALQLLKLMTPFLPMTAERLWTRAFREPDGGSVFLSNALRGSQNWKSGKKRPAPPGSFEVWADAARAVQQASIGGVNVVFYNDVEEWQKMFDESAEGLRMFAEGGFAVWTDETPPEDADARAQEVRVSNLNPESDSDA